MEIERIKPEYIGNNAANGIKIDWKEIFRLYNEIGCPDNVYNPSELPIDEASWFILTSERNTGKTTNLVLIAMLLFLRYGMMSAYLRQHSDMITPKEMRNFMNVIIACQYVQKLTNGEYNGVRYWARHYTFVRWSADGKREAESDPFLWVGSLNEHETYKSTLNLPTCNLIIYDEFISDDYNNDFITLMDIHKTIGRNRKELKCCLLANTTNYYHEFFREFLIQDEVLNTKVNHSFIKKTPLGTRVYYKMIGDKDPQRSQINVEYYGFNNPRLKSITGGDWAVNSYPHIRREERDVIYRNVYIYFNGRYFQIELVHNERLGLHIIVHLAHASNVAKYADRIYTVEEIRQRNEVYGYGGSKLDKQLWKLYDNNKWYYADNDVGFSVNSYDNRVDK